MKSVTTKKLLIHLFKYVFLTAFCLIILTRFCTLFWDPLSQTMR